MVTVVSTLLQRLIEMFVVILIAIHIPTIVVIIPSDNSFVVRIAAVSVFVGIVRVVAVGIAAAFFGIAAAFAFVGIADVSAFVGIVRVFRAGLGVGTVAEFACL